MTDPNSSRVQHTPTASSEPYQLFDNLDDETYQALKDDIRQHGVMVPVEYDDAGNILDGHHRVRAHTELAYEGVELAPYPRIIREGLSEADKRAHVRRLHMLRRHLTQEQRRELIQDQIRETPKSSDRKIANVLGVSPTTVGTVRKEIALTVQIGQSDEREGADGRTIKTAKIGRSGWPSRRDVDAYQAEMAAYSVDQWNALTEDERRRIIESAPLASDTRFNRTNENVDWSRWTWNPVTGCLHDCDYCYARDIANRFYTDLPDGQRFEPFFRPSRLHAPRQMTVPRAFDPEDPTTIGEKNVFTGSMTDLFGKWVPQDWIDAVFAEAIGAPDWNFLFLTKFPQRLAEQDWPTNAWVGTTVDRQARVATAERSFRGVKAGIRWLSCEPLLERLTFSDLSMFDWVVIGASSKSTQTPEFQPPREWVDHLIRQADDAGCQVYEKPNLRRWRQEYPSGAIAR